MAKGRSGIANVLYGVEAAVIKKLDVERNEKKSKIQMQWDGFLRHRLLMNLSRHLTQLQGSSVCFTE